VEIAGSQLTPVDRNSRFVSYRPAQYTPAATFLRVRRLRISKCYREAPPTISLGNALPADLSQAVSVSRQLSRLRLATPGSNSGKFGWPLARHSTKPLGV